MTALLVPAGAIVSGLPQLDLAVGPQFERFDGLEVPDTNPAGDKFSYSGETPTPGRDTTPLKDQVYTPGPLRGVVGTVDGQPLQAVKTDDRIHRPAGDYTPARTLSIQHRLGVGQVGPSALGAAQTNQMANVTDNPPQPGDLNAIIGGIY